METPSTDIIAACGLVCNECGIYKATNDAKVAEGVAKWFRENQGAEMKASDVHCEGCRGNRERHWSADCWILKCCVEDRGLENCSQCGEFPCSKLVDWSKGSDRYADAFNRLQSMCNRTNLS